MNPFALGKGGATGWISLLAVSFDVDLERHRDA